MFGTKTKEDAYRRVISAIVDCCADNPSEEYLLALRKHIHLWGEMIDARLVRLWTKQVADSTDIEEDDQDEHAR